jgi:hydrogenase nickel incorporation protein HypA/HybF
MHEVALADAVVAIAARHAGDRRVVRVELKVGALRQVVPDALEFAFGLVAEGTPVAGAELAMQFVPAAGRCRACGTQSELLAFPLLCPGCGSANLELTQGEELLVDALELEERTPTAIGGMRDGG